MSQAERIISVRDITARDIFELMLTNAAKGQSNEFRVEEGERRSYALAIALKTGRVDEDGQIKPVSDRRIKQAITELVRHGVIERYGKSRYRLASDGHYVGNTDSLIDAQERFRERRQAEKA